MWPSRSVKSHGGNAGRIVARESTRRQGLIVKTDWFSPSSHGAAVQAMLAVAGPGIPKSASPSLFLRLSIDLHRCATTIFRDIR
jgi:hypothetical protein